MRRYNKTNSFVSDVYRIFKIILPLDSLHYLSMLNLVEYLLSDDSGPILQRMGNEDIFSVSFLIKRINNRLCTNKSVLNAVFCSALDSTLSINIYSHFIFLWTMTNKCTIN